MATMRIACLLVFASMSVAAFGADIYKWVDEKDRVQYGESVPAKYKNSATKIAPGEAQPQPTEAQRQEALARAARDKATEESMAASTAKSGKPVPVPAPKPPAVSADSSDSTEDRAKACDAEKRKYQDSLACFAPYKTPSGGITDEGVQHCVALKEPTC